jgi:hypothetical protein
MQHWTAYKDSLLGIIPIIPKFTMNQGRRPTLHNQHVDPPTQIVNDAFSASPPPERRRSHATGLRLCRGGTTPWWPKTRIHRAFRSPVMSRPKRRAEATTLWDGTQGGVTPEQRAWRNDRSYCWDPTHGPKAEKT